MVTQHTCHFNDGGPYEECPACVEATRQFRAANPPAPAPPPMFARYVMVPDVEHNSMSGHCGEPVVRPVIDPAGEWVKAADIAEHLRGILAIGSGKPDA